MKSGIDLQFQWEQAYSHDYEFIQQQSLHLNSYFEDRERFFVYVFAW